MIQTLFKIEEVTQQEMLVKEEEGQSEVLHKLPAYECLLDLLLSTSEEELVKLANMEQYEWVYFNPQKQKKCSYVSNPVFEIIRLIEYMLTRLLNLKSNSNK